MKRICIGIHVHAEPDRLLNTLASVRANTTAPIELILLPDGPDAATCSVLAGLSHLRQFHTAEPLGPPACFNRLAASTDAEVLVLLESGAQVGPGWLDHLLAALQADPQTGLAGPSTNRSWNEQGVFPRAGDTPAAIAHTAGMAVRRFGNAVRTLEPLYSLADFCYVVKREVIAAIGAADEWYGLGPCWEMDYNIRAARAGWRAVWAGAAYVHRAPFTPRRQREESLRFEASKHRYQDKFCALRLRGERTEYEPHCRGAACEHFAPAELIQISLPLAPADKLQPTGANPPAPPLVPAANDSPPLPVIVSQPAAPLVSCIMPTGNRAVFALQAIRYFLRQDYPNRELIVADDGTDNLAAQLPDDPRIRYLRLPSGLSIGAKRNHACAAAHGSIIAQWDDDDWYGAQRLATQIEPLLAGKADISALTTWLFFDLPRWTFWRCTPELHRRLFVEDIHGGTLVYRRQVWEQWARYPDRSLAEDALFLRQAHSRGARLQRLPGDGLFIYVRHGANSWRFECGHYLDAQSWQQRPEPAFPLEDRAFYADQSGNQPPEASTLSVAPVANLPLVSCIMPTANRRPFVAKAIRYFLRQDYPHKELVILDDGADSVADLVPADPCVRYIRLSGTRTLGAKRNECVEASHGDLILHWDDDDWYAPHRIRYQVLSLLAAQVEICGLQRMYYYDLLRNDTWLYQYPANQRPWLAGNSLLYTRAFWQQAPFPHLQVGEDTRFLWSHSLRQMLVLPDHRFYVALVHSGNTSPKHLNSAYWSRSSDNLKTVMGEDWELYRQQG